MSYAMTPDALPNNPTPIAISKNLKNSILSSPFGRTNLLAGQFHYVDQRHRAGAREPGWCAFDSLDCAGARDGAPDIRRNAPSRHSHSIPSARDTESVSIAIVRTAAIISSMSFSCSLRGRVSRWLLLLTTRCCLLLRAAVSACFCYGFPGGRGARPRHQHHGRCAAKDPRNLFCAFDGQNDRVSHLNPLEEFFHIGIAHPYAAMRGATPDRARLVGAVNSKMAEAQANPSRAQRIVLAGGNDHARRGIGRLRNAVDNFEFARRAGAVFRPHRHAVNLHRRAVFDHGQFAVWDADDDAALDGLAFGLLWWRRGRLALRLRLCDGDQQCRHRTH